MTGHFHRISDLDRLYLPRKLGGRGLKSIKLVYAFHIISIRKYLLNSSRRSHYLKCVVEREQEKIMRVEKELLDIFETKDKSTLAPGAISQKHLNS